jgi:hypothetical protein
MDSDVLDEIEILKHYGFKLLFIKRSPVNIVLIIDYASEMLISGLKNLN